MRIPIIILLIFHPETFFLSNTMYLALKSLFSQLKCNGMRMKEFLCGFGCDIYMVFLDVSSFNYLQIEYSVMKPRLLYRLSYIKLHQFQKNGML